MICPLLNSRILRLRSPALEQVSAFGSESFLTNVASPSRHGSQSEPQERNRRATVQMRVFSCADAECRTTTPVSVLSGTNLPAPQQTQGTMLVTFRRSTAARACPHLLKTDPLTNIPGISIHLAIISGCHSRLKCHVWLLPWMSKRYCLLSQQYRAVSIFAEISVSQ